MPQAIKRYSGLVSSSTSTVYTCPSSTIAIVMPSINIGSAGSQGNTTIGWNSSSTCVNATGNLMFKDVDYGANYLVSCTDKYDVQAAVRPSESSKTCYSPHFTTNVDQVYYGFVSLFDGNPTNSGHAASPRQSVQGYGAGSSYAYNHIGWVPTGPWTMSAGHKLSIHVQSLYVHYNFLIIEEAV